MKSSVVAYSFGVLHILISQADPPSTFLERLLQQCGKVVEARTEAGIETLTHQASRCGNIPVTFVLVVVRSDRSVLDSVKCIAEQLAAAANVIAILSEANAGLIRKFIQVTRN